MAGVGIHAGSFRRVIIFRLANWGKCNVQPIAGLNLPRIVTVPKNIPPRLEKDSAGRPHSENRLIAFHFNRELDD